LRWGLFRDYTLHKSLRTPPTLPLKGGGINNGPILSKTMMQLLMRANKNALFPIYMNREPGTVIPAKAGIQSLQLRKNHWMPAPCLRRGMLFGHDEILIFFLKDFI